MNSKIIILVILVHMAVLVSCHAIDIDPTKPDDYHKEYLEYKIKQVDGQIAHEKKLNKGNFDKSLETRKNHYEKMLEDPKPKNPLALPKEVNRIKDVKYTNEEGKVIPDLVGIGYEIARLDKELNKITFGTKKYHNIEKALHNAETEFDNVSVLHGLANVILHNDYLDYKIKKLEENDDKGRLAYFKEAKGEKSRIFKSLPLPMALPEIGVKEMKYTDENGIPIETLKYIGYEIAFLKSELESSHKQEQSSHQNETQIEESVSQNEKDLKEALHDMEDELKRLGQMPMPIPKTENSQTLALNGNGSVEKGKTTDGGENAITLNAQDSKALGEYFRVLTEHMENIQGVLFASVKEIISRGNRGSY